MLGIAVGINGAMSEGGTTLMHVLIKVDLNKASSVLEKIPSVGVAWHDDRDY